MSRAALAAMLAAPLVAYGLSLGFAAGAGAQTAEQVTALRTTCETDVKKLCAGIQPGGGRLLQCLKEHKDEVTPPCQASLGALAASMRKQ